MSTELDALHHGIRAARAGDLTLASTVLQEVVQQYPRSVEAWLCLGLVVDDAADA